MRLRRLELTGFGRFVAKQVELEDGLNVFHGANESGKTTIQHFLRGMLYGLKQPDALRRRWTAEWERYLPWSGKPYSGALEFCTPDGRSYRVERQFAKERDRVQVFDAVTGRDISSSFESDQRRELLFAEKFTGMNELVFASTVCIGDLPDTTAEKGRQELAARLANLQESADEATSVRKAFESLEATRRGLVTRCNQLQKSAGVLEQDLASIMAHRAALRVLEMRLRELEKEQEQESQLQHQARAAITALDIAGLEQKQRQAESLQEEIAGLAAEVAALAIHAQFPVHRLDQVKGLQTRIDEGSRTLQLLTAEAHSLQEELEAAQDQLLALPGAEGMVRALEAGDALGERTRSLTVRLTEALEHLRESGRQLEEAERQATAAAGELQAYEGLATLPVCTPQVLAELDACGRGAATLSESWQALARRRRALAERLHVHEDRARALARQLQDLELVDSLPQDAARQMEGLLVEVQALTRGMGDALQARASLLRRIAECDEALRNADHLAALPPDTERLVQELQLCVHSGKQRIAALRTLVDQLRVGLSRQNRSASTLQRLTGEIERSEHLAAITLAEVHAAEGWLLRWRSAESEAAVAGLELDKLMAAQAAVGEALEPLREVGGAGVEQLARAVQLAKQEAEARERVRRAEAEAAGLPDPPSGRRWLGMALLLGGMVLAAAATWVGWAPWLYWAGVWASLAGAPLLIAALQQNARVLRSRQALYSKKGEALASAEKLNAELRPMLARVRQPSVAAWDDAWPRFASLQAQWTALHNQIELEDRRQEGAAKTAAEAREAVQRLLHAAGRAPADATQGPDEVTRMLADLAQALLTRHNHLRERSAARVELAAAREQVASAYRDTVDALHQLFPNEREPQEPDMAWAQGLLDEATRAAASAASELSALLARAKADSPAALLQQWRERHTMMARRQSLRRDLEEREAALQDLWGRRSSCAEQVMQLLELAGVTTADGEMAAAAEMSDGDAARLPWTAADIESFLGRLRRHGELRREAAALPQELPTVLRDTEQLLEETKSSERAGRDLQVRLGNALRSLPLVLEPALLAAATGEEERAEKNGILMVSGTGLPASLWPERLDQLLAGLPSVGGMERWRRTMLELRNAARSGSAALLEAAGAADREQFHQRWDECQKARRLAGEKEQLRDAQGSHFHRLLSHTIQLLSGEVMPLLQRAGVAAPPLPLGESDAYDAETLSIWQETLTQAVLRVDAVEASYGRREEARQRLEERRREIEERQGGINALAGELEDLLRQSGVGSVPEFVAACQAQTRWEQAVLAEQACHRQMQALLGDTTLDDLRELLQAKREELPLMAGDLDLPTPQPQDRQYWESRLQQASLTLASLRDRRAEMLGDMKSHTSACEGEERVVAELDNVSTERAQLERALAALHLAREELELASEEVHRQFAPALNAHASEILNALTRGRYEQLAVAETLEITLRDPEFERQVGLDAVSHGTCDQVYLAFRLAAAQAVCGDVWTPPIILDDAFAHYDDARAEEALQTLLHMAEKTQVLFFTCRWREVDILQRLSDQTGIRFQLIELGDAMP